MARLMPSILLLLASPSLAYKPLSDSFLQQTPSFSDADLDTDLVAPLLRLPSRAAGTPGHAAAQAHLAGFFATELPAWTMEWQNITEAVNSTGHTAQHLVFRREPPWTRPGQANLLTLAARYDASGPAAAVACALLMHAARSVDRFTAQMYREMEELGEGGTVAMDMGMQLVFLDGGRSASSASAGPASLAAAWENATNPALPASSYGYPNRLNQISLLVLLDGLGIQSVRGPGFSPDPVPSRYPTTHWTYRAAATIERRLRSLDLLEGDSSADQPLLPDDQTPVLQSILAASRRAGSLATSSDYLPFMRRGVSVLPLMPDRIDQGYGNNSRSSSNGTTPVVDYPTAIDWSRIVTAFVLEWLDMMEVEPVP
ncbi:glutaminyl-peptide cyclotransferase [Grosmannia clavigera kw1407]|uniref:Glutaminyl-peptide cyclotransferase n=1 Tax=Grosmannia clavigera (strain kw1407 / UAMH 11150) TaxID=655863 RepID=F0XRX5_GROCL|nr:glutaminyl-peptide cyclotransferase [Grosmannia clavigera kw1407]EFW99632.1 glutaminyl-peptide cyclotransferase [Grosmannia clavigera kw1407]